MKTDYLEVQAALMEAVDSVNDVITISKRARRIGTIKQFISRFRNSRSTAKFGRRKKSQRTTLNVKPQNQGNYQTQRPYGIHTC